MLDRPVRVGLIGCGAQANVHARAVGALGPETAEIVAACDLDEARLRAVLGAWPGARGACDYRDLLEPGDLDLIVVATMPNTHAEISLAALDAGAHVLCEKPFMMNLEEAAGVLEKAAVAGRYVQLATNMRYMPSSQYARRLVESGAVGEPVSAKAWGCHRNPPVWGPHYHVASSGGGVLASTLVHTLDLAVWIGLSPDPISVSASTARLFPGKRGPKTDEVVRRRYDAEDLVGGFVRFSNGMFCSLEGNWCSEVTDFHGCELTTTRATLSSAPFAVRVDEDGEVVDRTPELEGPAGWNESVGLQDADLIGRLRRGQAWDMQDARQLLNLQKIVDGCYESARLGREVAL